MSAPNFDEIKALVDQALADKQLTRAEQQAIMQAILADNQVSEAEQQLLEGIADKIRTGKIKVVD